MSINTIILTGRLTKDPEIKYTQKGTAVATFTVAVQRNFKNAQGQYDADFIRCQVWNKTAEFLGNHFQKGSGIEVVGRLEVRNYQDNQGNNRIMTEVIASNISFATGGNSQQQNNQQDTQKTTDNTLYTDSIDFDDVPF